MDKPLVRISVRNLVEFILRSGDLDNRRGSADKEAMLKGSRLHRKIQGQMGSHYRAEVSLKYITEYEDVDIQVEGRADGIFMESDQYYIDEIKGIYADVSQLEKPAEVHRAQAMCYAWIYAQEQQLEKIGVQMTYGNLDTEELRYFREDHTLEELRQWYQELMDRYHKWIAYQLAWKKERNESMNDLEFPFEYREGQRRIVSGVYHTISTERQIFIQAPTGVGKTMSAIFPAVRAVGAGMGENIFYLTAKTITRTVAEEAFSILKEHGLKFKVITITAKEKLCFCDKTECNPENCLWARGHLDRVNDAVYELWTTRDRYDREILLEYARKWQVCPFELCLDLAVWVDAVICDYNYVFDPNVYLKRFFGEGTSGEYIFLIDEAHNLLERGREMYSAALYKEDFLKMKKLVKKESPKLEKQLEKCNKELLAMKRECENYRREDMIAPFVMALTRAYATLDEFLEEHETMPERKDLLDFYFDIAHFLNMYEIMYENYVVYSQQLQEGEFMLKLFCVNPANNLKACMQKGRSTILFSATFLPIQYYKKLLGGEEQDYEVYAQSAFQEEKRKLLLANDVTSKYTRRSDEEYRKIARYIYEIVQQRYGNYMVFFPSHAFLEEVYDCFMQEYFDESCMECVVQEEYMSEQMREEFLNRFTGNTDCDLTSQISFDIEEDEDTILIGFCVMGGIFSEGIDLKNDSLIGAMIVGTGLPQVCCERELLKEYFDEQGENGFDYAYRFPGMNKVLQSAGRVIRTAQDVGVIALLDERFITYQYRRMFPREWSQYEVVSVDEISRRVEKFWNDWL